MKRPDGRTGRAKLVRLWVHVVSKLVPADRRAEWLEEWLAEIDAHSGRSDAAEARGTDKLHVRAWGALNDALYLRRRSVALTGYGRELRVVVRGLLRRPGFTAVVLSTLALGIGVNAALFSLVHAVLLRPLPYAEPERLVRLWSTQKRELALGGTVSYPDVHEIGARTNAFAAWAAFDEWRPAIGGEDAPAEVVFGGTVNAAFFDVVGVRPALGRFFTPEEEGVDRELRVVLAHGLWQRLGADPRIVGGTILVNGNATQVIGVLPSDFESPGLEGGSWGSPEVWRTVATPPEFRSGRSWAGVARLADGVTLAAAQAEVDAATASLEREYPDDNLGWGVQLVPLRDQLVGDADRVLMLLAGAVGLLLLVACANVAGLLLVRAVERRRELDVRIALGASRARVAMSTLLESLLLSGLGAALGLALAALLMRVLSGRLVEVLPRAGELALEPAVVWFGVGLALFTGLVLGVAPALDALRRSGRRDGSHVASAARGGTGGPDAAKLRRVLVLAEVATSVVLLIGAAVLVRNLGALYRVDLGIERRGVVTATLHSAGFANLSPEEADALYDGLVGRLRALPGVQAAGGINILPLGGGFSCDGVTREDLPPPAPDEERCAEIRAILPGTLTAFGIPTLGGRAPDERDTHAEAPRVIAVSREMADAFWPGEDPLGKRVTVHGESWEVVGVVGDVRHFGPAGTTRPQAYIPAHRDPWGGVSYGLSLVIRGSGDARDLAPHVRVAVAEQNATLALTSVLTMDDLLGGSVASSRFQTVLLGSFAALALLLAMVGLGGVVAYSVRQRTREIGVRMALGAAPRKVSAMVMAEAARLVFGGATAGVLMALMAVGVLDGTVHGVGARDPWSFAVAAGLIGVFGLAVSLFPAARAGRVEPLRALSRES